MSSVFDDEVDPALVRVSTTVRLKRTLLTKLDDIAESETSRRKAANKRAAGLSRNDVIERLLERGVDAYGAEGKKAKK